jgi:hypothetical protein
MGYADDTITHEMIQLQQEMRLMWSLLLGAAPFIKRLSTFRHLLVRGYLT